MHWRWGLLLVLVIPACGGPETTTAEPDDSATSSESTETAGAGATMRVRGMELSLYDPAQRGATQRRTSFRVRADEGRPGAERGVWELTNLDATVYPGTEDEVRLQAERGTLDENGETAELLGNVRVDVGAYAIRLQDITWNNTGGEATSDSAVAVESGESRLRAESLKLRPEEDTIILENAKGVLYFDEEEE